MTPTIPLQRCSVFRLFLSVDSSISLGFSGGSEAIVVCVANEIAVSVTRNLAKLHTTVVIIVVTTRDAGFLSTNTI
jgi:hypothetical protein